MNSSIRMIFFQVTPPSTFFLKNHPPACFSRNSNSIRLASSIVNIFKSSSSDSSSRRNSYRPRDSNANSNSANFSSANLNAFNPDKSSGQTPLKNQNSPSSINNKRLILPLENAPGFTKRFKPTGYESFRGINENGQKFEQIT